MNSFKTAYLVEVTELNSSNNSTTKYYEYFDNETKALNFVDNVNRTRDMLNTKANAKVVFANYVGNEVIEY